MKKEGKETPLMKQYAGFKQQYPGALLLFRVGDFYETFGEDAIETSKILGIVLTKRSNGGAADMELAGFPHHSLDNYLPRLVRAGKKVAVVDQLEDPKMAKGIVKRGVTELVSPGVAYSDRMLEQKESNFLACMVGDDPNIGLSLVDISTGKWLTARGEAKYIDRLLQSFRPSEVLMKKSWRATFSSHFGEDYYITGLEDWIFDPDYAKKKIKGYFSVASVKGFGIEHWPEALTAAGACLHFLSESHIQHTGHLQHISRIEPEGFMWLDRFTIRNLELLHSPHEKGVALADVLDLSQTPMGARLLRQWITLPLCDLASIEQRHEVVEWFVNQSALRRESMSQLSAIHDLERLISRVALRKTNPRELLMLAQSMEHGGALRQKLHKEKSLQPLLSQWPHEASLSQIIRSKISEDAGVSLQKGNVFNSGIHQELDELKQLSRSGKEYLLTLQQREVNQTGISSLKIGFNNVFGYYLEVTHAHKEKVPVEWIRKQTLTNAERYITPELKDYEEKIIGAEEKIQTIEAKLFEELVDEISPFLPEAIKSAQALATLDVLISFAELSDRWNYIKPKMVDTGSLILKGTRHPVIEQRMAEGQSYIPNDVVLDKEKQRMIILTGPNMSGKSAILRQTALSIILSHMGCFVPCLEAQIPLTDKVFTRVGASDNISSGESTFMVEMTETAGILNNLSDRSFVFLDEIGRGTATFDGISLAWSIAEYLVNHSSRPLTIFATHYHELNEMEKQIPQIKNFHIQIIEQGNKIIFLRKLSPGGSEHSFGIHVAKMAAIPNRVTQRAEEIMKGLEASRGQSAPLVSQSHSPQLSFFTLDDPLLERINEELRKLDVNRLTPLEALMKLHHIKGLLEKS